MQTGVGSTANNIWDIHVHYIGFFKCPLPAYSIALKWLHPAWVQGPGILKPLSWSWCFTLRDRGFASQAFGPEASHTPHTLQTFDAKSTKCLRTLHAVTSSEELQMDRPPSPCLGGTAGSLGWKWRKYREKRPNTRSTLDSPAAVPTASAGQGVHQQGKCLSGTAGLARSSECEFLFFQCNYCPPQSTPLPHRGRSC